MYPQVSPQAASSERSVPVTLAQAARRTGLADSGEALALACAKAELPVTTSGVRRYVDLCAFLGESAAVELGEVAVLECGRLS